MGPYQSFTELVLNAIKGEDYEVIVLNRAASTTVAAIHAGCIEPPTGELARAIAAEDWNLYELRGLRPEKASLLRIPAARYDEMRLRTLMECSESGLAVLEVEGSSPVVHLGGSNQTLKRMLAEQLVVAGFHVAGPATPGAAHDPTRFYNLPANGGVQLELTRCLCEELRGGPQAPRYHALVMAVRTGLTLYHAVVRDDVERALQRFERATAAMPPTVRKTGPCTHEH